MNLMPNQVKRNLKGLVLEFSREMVCRDSL